MTENEETYGFGEIIGVQLCWLYKILYQAESNMNDLISEYQQYQEATVDDD